VPRKKKTESERQRERVAAHRARKLCCELERAGYTMQELIEYTRDPQNKIPWAWPSNPAKPKKLSAREVEQIKTKVPEYLWPYIGKRLGSENITVDDLPPSRKVVQTLVKSLRKKRPSGAR
jgi:hypothetical protein